MNRRRVKNIDIDTDDYDDIGDFCCLAAKPSKQKKWRNSTKSGGRQIADTRKTFKAPGSEEKTVQASSASKNRGKATIIEQQRQPEKAESSNQVRQSATFPEPSGAVTAAPLPLNLVVIGHVDSGKSTLLGHLLCLCGTVSESAFSKQRREAQRAGKASFAFAWLFDEGGEERERGITLDVTVKQFSSGQRQVIVYDAPGHKELVGNMLRGAVLADAALLVVDVTNVDAGISGGWQQQQQRGEKEGKFETSDPGNSTDQRGQTIEHLQLVRALGLKHLVVVVNKMDAVQWSRWRFEATVAKVGQVASDIGFKSGTVEFVPASAFQGTNVSRRAEEDEKREELGQAHGGQEAYSSSWWKDEYTSVLGAIDKLPSVGAKLEAGNFCACVADVSGTAGGGNNLYLSAKVDRGVLSLGDRVMVLPSLAVGVCKRIKLVGATSDGAVGGVQCAEAGRYVEVMCLANVNAESVWVGSVLVAYNECTDVRICRRIEASVLVLSNRMPIVKGMQVILHSHLFVCTATVGSIVGVHDKTTKAPDTSKKHKALLSGMVGIIDITTPTDICVTEQGRSVGCLDRVVLRLRGETIAAGIVVRAFET